ncbi:MAG: OmpA family protein [Bacteroidota bacterium]|nr:OmpA family protein [Bacteroidota bacterium]
MKIQKISFYGLILLLSFYLVGCSTTGSIEKADEAFDMYQFNMAADMYRKVYRKVKDKNKKYEIKKKLALSYEMMSQYKRAESYYKQAIKFKNSEPEIIYNLADMMKRQEKYEDALVEFKKYVREMPGDPEGQIAIETCEKALKWKEEQTRYVVEDFRRLNSRDNDFAPMFYRKGAIVITSDRDDATGRNLYNWTGEKHTDIFVASMTPGRKNRRLLKPVRIDEDEIVNTKFNEGVAGFDRRMRTMYYTQCNDGKGKGHNCRIFVVRKRGKVWGEPEPLPFCTDSFAKYGHPTLSPNGKKLYFASNMEGTLGKHDIWMSSFVRRGRTWSDPVNLGPVINTKGNELYPYAYTNKRLYFASDKHPGIGGLDIFYSEKDENGKWSKPVNLKMPINSGGDDFAIVIEKGGTVAKGYKGMFSSNRPGSRGDDIYSFYMTPLIYTLSGTVFNLRTKETIEGATVNLRINDTTNLSVQTDKSGYYHYDLEPENEYAVSAFKKYYFDSETKFASTVGLEFSEDFVRDLYLDPFITDEIELEGIFYDLDKYDLRPESMVILDSLYQILIKHPYIVIELASHTDCRATQEYNLELSNNRAQSVVDYLIYKGIPMDRLSPKGYGETQLVNNCDCENGQGNGINCSEDEHQQNRRTTFKILSTDYEYGAEQIKEQEEKMPEWMKRRYGNKATKTE